MPRMNSYSSACEEDFYMYIEVLSRGLLMVIEVLLLSNQISALK